MMVESSGGVSTESIAAKFRAAMADSTIGAVVLAFDTPGGSVAGVTELANEIYRARGTKPIVSVADSLAASAGYWLAAAADEVVVSPSAEIGSVGVILAHSEVSEAMAKEGVRVTVISAGEHKAEHSPYAPLTEDAKAELQRRVDAAYSVFVGDLAKFRGVGVETVRNNFGGGRVYGGKEAVSRGMADRVATIDETIARLAGPRRIVNAARAERARMLLY
jgi:signal peptide peptidase SppA